MDKICLMVILLFMPAVSFAEEIPNMETMKKWKENFISDECQRTYSKSITKIFIEDGEEAYITTCYEHPSEYLLLIRTSLESVKTIYQSKHIYYLKVIDLDHDGISEIEADEGYSNQGITEGSKLIFNIVGGEMNILYEKNYDSCDEPQKYIEDSPQCTNGNVRSVLFEYKDINSDGLLDLIETVTLVNIEIDKGITKDGALKEPNYIHIKDKTSVNKYIFKNKKFIVHSNEEDRVRREIMNKRREM